MLPASVNNSVRTKTQLWTCHFFTKMLLKAKYISACCIQMHDYWFHLAEPFLAIERHDHVKLYKMLLRAFTLQRRLLVTCGTPGRCCRSILRTGGLEGLEKGFNFNSYNRDCSPHPNTIISSCLYQSKQIASPGTLAYRYRQNGGILTQHGHARRKGCDCDWRISRNWCRHR